MLETKKNFKKMNDITETDMYVRMCELNHYLLDFIYLQFHSSCMQIQEKYKDDSYSVWHTY